MKFHISPYPSQSLPFYQAITFALLLFSGALQAQEKQILVEKIPVERNAGERLTVLLQDSTGLIWLRSANRLVNQNGKQVEVPGRWFNSNGEKIFEVPFPPVPDSSRQTLRFGSHFHAPNECMYLAGDSVRIFDVYTHRIVMAIGFEAELMKKGKTPVFIYCSSPSDSVIWAVANNNKVSDVLTIVPDLMVVVSCNGGPFKKVIKAPNSFEPLHFAARSEQFFMSTNDTIRQYNLEGKLVKTHVLPKVNAKPLRSSYRFQEGEDVQFFHYVKNNKTGGYDKAIYRLAPGDTAFVAHPCPELNGVSFYNIIGVGNHYWLIGDAMLLNYLSVDDRKVIDYSKYILQQHPELAYFQEFIISIVEDRSGAVWMSMTTGDVLKISSPIEPFTNYLSGKKTYNFCNNNTCSIRGMASDGKGNLYFAYDYGIEKMNMASGKLSNLTLDLPEKLRDVFSLSFYNQKLYLNALEIDPLTGKTKALIPNTNTQRITHYIDRDKGQMWIADGGNINNLGEPIRLYRYDFKTQTFSFIATFEDTPSNKFNQVSQFHISPTTHTLFMATTQSGIYELNLDGTVVQRLFGGETYGILHTTLALYEDDNQQLWIGHGGLSKLDLKTREFTKVPYQLKATSAPSYVYSIQRQNKTFCWLGTARGLYRLNVESGELRNFQMFPAQSGTEFNRLSNFQDNEGKQYFGSVGGLFVFDPEQLVTEARLDESFPIQVSQFFRYDTKKEAIVHTYEGLSSTSIFHLYANHRYFSMEVFVADFRDAQKNTYTWWLENYESDWSSPTTSNTMRYDNLPPGEYVLHVRGGILPENYESSERQFQIIVHQAWYKTWWAWCLYIGAFLGLVYLVYRYQVKQHLEKAEAIRLKELDTLKSRLYTNITHEFRTPLTVIMGMTEQLAVGSWQSAVGASDREKLKGVFSLIMRNSKNLLRLINQLLDLAKLDSGTMKMDVVHSDIINYLQYLTESFHSMAHEKKVRLTFYSEIPELVMDFDEVKIQHVIYNLLSNALKFTKEGGKVVLHAQLSPLQGSGAGQPFLKLKVQDTGIGIPEGQLAHIFDRFFQADSSSTRKGEGTGIGLALTKELVELMGGSISVESTLGKGTNFTLLLPIRLEVTTPAPQTAFPSSRTLAPELVPDLHTPTITEATDNEEPLGNEKPVLLIIEDNADVVTYIVGLLEREYDITTAANGQHGVDKAFEIIPDIVISDVMMPEKDGYEVCEALKNDERTSHIPIILLTAKAETADRITGLRKGADAYLMKPFNKEELHVRLEKLLELRRALQQRYAGERFEKSSRFVKSKTSEPTLDDLFLQKLQHTVIEYLDKAEFGAEELCRAVNLSPSQLYRKMAALTGEPPNAFIRKIRLHQAKEMLETTGLNISEIAYSFGFNDPNYFSRVFAKEFGNPPIFFRK